MANKPANKVEEMKLPNPFEPVNIEIAVNDESENYAKIVVRPLERGFGITLGNALRRVLLSALPGASVVAVEIEGARHEFTALKGVEEDVTAIILNLKDLVLKIDEDSAELKRIDVDLKGPATLKAGDLELPAFGTASGTFVVDCGESQLSQNSLARMIVVFEILMGEE